MKEPILINGWKVVTLTSTSTNIFAPVEYVYNKPETQSTIIKLVDYLIDEGLIVFPPPHRFTIFVNNKDNTHTVLLANYDKHNDDDGEEWKLSQL